MKNRKSVFWMQREGRTVQGLNRLKTQQNCFWKSGLVKKNETSETQEMDNDDAASPPPDTWDYCTSVTFEEECLAMDEEVEVCGELSDQDI